MMFGLNKRIDIQCRTQNHLVQIQACLEIFSAKNTLYKHVFEILFCELASLNEKVHEAVLDVLQGGRNSQIQFDNSRWQHPRSAIANGIRIIV